MENEQHKSIPRQLVASVIFGPSFAILLFSFLFFDFLNGFLWGIAIFVFLQVLTIYLVTRTKNEIQND